jgi:cytoskeleton protein RodZ
MLRDAREHSGKSTRDVAQALALETGLVAAIEEDRYEAFGAGVFARGHLRRYALLVECDVDQVLACWDRDYGAPPASAPPATRRVDVRKPSRNGPIVVAVVAMLIVVALVLFVWWWLRPLPSVATPVGEPSPQAAADIALDNGPGEPSSAPRGSAPTGDVDAAADRRADAPVVDAGAESNGAAPALAGSGRLTLQLPPAADGVDGGDADATADADANDTMPTEADPVAVASESPVATAAAADPSAAPSGDTAASGADTDTPRDRDTADEVADGPSVTVRFEFDEPCWVNVRDATGRQLMFGLREPGRVDSRVGVAPISVTLGRYPGVRVSVDGEPFDVPEDAVDNAIARFEIPAP